MALEQIVKRSPVNLRPLLGVRPAASSKSKGVFAASFLKMWHLAKEKEHLENAQLFLDELSRTSLPGYSGHCWGNAYDHQSRSFYYSKDIPTLVGTAVIAHAFLDAYDCMGEARYLEIARSTGEFIMRDLAPKSAEGQLCLQYIPGSATKIYNASALGAALLQRLNAIRPERELDSVAGQAVRFVLSRQRADGAWEYGEDANLSWIDNFHSAYVLQALHEYAGFANDSGPDEAIRRGLEFYLDHFFLDDGTPRYYADNTYPIDIQCAAGSIVALCALSGLDSRCLPLAEKVATWTMANMRSPSGCFYYRRGRWLTNKTPMIYWAEANMLYALATLLTAQTRAERSGLEQRSHK